MTLKHWTSKLGLRTALLACALPVLSISVMASAQPANGAPILPGVPNQADPLQAALQALSRGELDTARAQFQALREVNPRAPQPYLGLADVELRKNNAEGAGKVLDEAIAAIPDSAGLYTARGRISSALRKSDESEKFYRKAMELQPKSVSIMIDFADSLASFNKLDLATDLYRGATTLEKDNPAPWFGLGLAQARAGRTDEAVAALATAQRLSPSNPMPSVSSAQVQARAGRLSEALLSTDNALKIQPVFLPARIARGEIMLALRRPADAVVEFETALKQEPKLVPALLGLGMAHQANKADDKAESPYRRALEVDPKNIIAMNNLASSLAARKVKLDEAISLARTASAAVPSEPALRDTLGWALRQKGDANGAVAELEQVVKARPVAEFYFHLGQARADLGQKDTAMLAYREALKIDPAYAPALDAVKAMTTPAPAPAPAPAAAPRKN